MKYIIEYNTFNKSKLSKYVDHWYNDLNDSDKKKIESVVLNTNIFLDDVDDDNLHIVKFVKHKNDVIYTMSLLRIHHDGLAEMLGKELSDKNVNNGFFQVEDNGKVNFHMSGQFDKHDVDIVIDTFNQNLKKDSVFKNVKPINKSKMFISNFNGRFEYGTPTAGVDKIPYKDFVRSNTSFYLDKLLIQFKNDLNALKEFDINKLKKIFPDISEVDAIELYDKIQRMFNKTVSKKPTSAEYKNLTTRYRFTESKES